MPRGQRKIGLVLSGGGSIGAWQAGVMQRMFYDGVAFHKIFGMSVGAINACGYAFDLMEFQKDCWTKMEKHRVLKPCWRHWPRALFCDQPVRSALSVLADEAQLMSRQRCSLYVASSEAGSGEDHVGVFERNGRWDGRLLDHVMASHAIPFIFPRVRLRRGDRDGWFQDGGLGETAGAALENFHDCDEIVFVSLPRPDPSKARGPLESLNARVQRNLHSQMLRAARVLASFKSRPVVRWLTPSRPWTQFVLDFRPEACRLWFERGREDAADFLSKKAEAVAPAEAAASPQEPDIPAPTLNRPTTGSEAQTVPTA
jgi:predicted acylesterase/phospholipase RssA